MSKPRMIHVEVIHRRYIWKLDTPSSQLVGEWLIELFNAFPTLSNETRQFSVNVYTVE